MNTKKLWISLLLLTSCCYGADTEVEDLNGLLRQISVDMKFIKRLIEVHPDLESQFKNAMGDPVKSLAASMSRTRNYLEQVAEDLEEQPRTFVPVLAAQPVHPSQVSGYVLLGIEHGKISPTGE